MPAKIAVHGSEAGYKTELQLEDVCSRCRAAHRVFQRQYSKKGRAAGIKYGPREVIDHLDTAPVTARYAPPRKTYPAPGQAYGPGEDTPGDTSVTDPGEASQDDSADGRLGDRLGAAFSGLLGNSRVAGDEPPDYLSPIDPDPEPASGDWEPIQDSEYIVNAAGLAKIEGNLGTYLSVVGITIEMIDPYCGPILASNFDNMVSKWAKLISHYPKAAEFFLNESSGIIMSWIAALQATWPFLYALYEHHLGKTVKQDPESGKFFRANKATMNGHNVDATMPPMDDYNYTAN